MKQRNETIGDAQKRSKDAVKTKKKAESVDKGEQEWEKENDYDDNDEDDGRKMMKGRRTDRVKMLIYDWKSAVRKKTVCGRE